jgi:type I restriction enzyme S subunit
MYYVLSAEAPKHVSAGMGNPKLMAGTMGNIQIALPSLQKQNEIVTVLDKFDSLVNGITEGIPGEIALRRAQYEYYRSKLLTFKKLEVA